MYLNTNYYITNTPSQFTAGYNTWQYNTPNWFQHTTKYYIDHNGVAQEWNHWNPPALLHVPGGMYKGTPTRTGGFYAQNTIVDPTRQNLKNGCNCN